MFFPLAILFFVVLIGVSVILAARLTDSSDGTTLGDHYDYDAADTDPIPLEEENIDPFLTSWADDEGTSGPAHPHSYSFIESNPPQCPLDESDSHVGAFTGHDWGGELGSDW